MFTILTMVCYDMFWRVAEASCERVRHVNFCLASLTISWFFFRLISSSFKDSMSPSRCMRITLVSSRSFLSLATSASTVWRMDNSYSILIKHAVYQICSYWMETGFILVTKLSTHLILKSSEARRALSRLMESCELPLIMSSIWKKSNGLCKSVWNTKQEFYKQVDVGISVLTLSIWWTVNGHFHFDKLSRW